MMPDLTLKNGTFAPFATPFSSSRYCGKAAPTALSASSYTRRTLADWYFSTRTELRCAFLVR